MKVTPLYAPQAPSVNNAQSVPQVSARDRAIAKLMESPAQSAPVPNPTSISPEEMGAVMSKPSESKASESTTGQSDTSVESKSSDSKAEPKVSEETLSSQYAILARKEKALRQREQQLKAKEASMTPEQPKEAAKPSQDLSKFVDKDRLVQDPFTVLQELGLTYDKLADLAVNAPKPEQIALNNEIKALKAQIAELKGETESTKKIFDERDKQQQDMAMKQLRMEAKAIIDNNPNFETVKATGSMEDVIQLMNDSLEKDGIYLSVEEAAQQVEDYLVEEALKLTKLSKIQSKLQPAKPAEEKKTEEPKQTQLKTLTNSVASSRPLTARERAVLAFQGKLQK